MRNIKDMLSINEGALKTIIQFTKLQGEVTKHYLELAKNDKGKALEDTEKYAKSIYNKFITDASAIEFDEWWKGFENSLGALFESNINEGWVGSEGEKAYNELSDALEGMDAVKFLDILWSWLDDRTLKNIYKWAKQDEIIC